MRNLSLFLGVLTCLAVVLEASPAARGGDGATTGAGDASTAAVRAILASRCFGCHAGQSPEAGFDLSRLSREGDVLGAFRTWEKVIQRVEAGQMPPEDARPLTESQRRSLTDWHRRTFVDLAPRPGGNRARRLTRIEYRNTLSDLLGIALRPGRRESFYNVESGSIVEKLLPPDPPGPSGFDNDASVLSLADAELAKYLQIAEYAVGQLDSAPEARRALFASTPSRDRDPAPREVARATLARFAPRAFRRPVDEAELAPYLALFDSAFASPDEDKGGDKVESPRRVDSPPLEDARFLRAIGDALTAILVSPKFLYRIERARGTHEPYRIGDYELATRLSYFLWSTMPDDELSRLAGGGRLHQADVLERQVERMLADPRSIALAENFGGQWLGFAELDHPERFQQARSEEETKLLRSISREPLLFFDDLVRSDRSLLELIDSRHAFLNPTLGYHYGLKGYKKPRLIKDGGYDWADPLERVAIDDPNRGGVLGMAATHLLTSAVERTSPIRRGVWILDAILGQRPADPPPNIPPLAEAGDGTRPLTPREQMELHRADISCARCHDAIDPLGLAMENYGPQGEWREKDASGTIDPSAILPGGERVRGPAELKSVLVQKYREPFVRNAVERMLSYALGRSIEYSDRPTIDRLVDALRANDYRFSVLVKGIVAGVPFGYRED